MRFRRPIDQSLHGVTDYTVGAALMTFLPKAAGVEGTQTAKQMRAAGAAHAGYSVFTDYPPGMVKLLPWKAHLALDLAGAVAVGALPFVTGQWKKGPKQWVPHVALAAFELTSLVFTDPTGRGDYHGNVEAVREANQVNPRDAIQNGGLAVKPATAQ